MHAARVNVTFGNVAELLLAIFAPLDGHADVANGQITGAIAVAPGTASRLDECLSLGVSVTAARRHGGVVLAVIGNSSDCLAAVFYARKNRMSMALSITVGSGIQVALLVAPRLV